MLGSSDVVCFASLRFASLRYAMLCYAMLCYAMLRCALTGGGCSQTWSSERATLTSQLEHAQLRANSAQQAGQGDVQALLQEKQVG